MKTSLKKANFKVVEYWLVDCPNCNHEQDAEFNDNSPMAPLTVSCEECWEPFILTYERD